MTDNKKNNELAELLEKASRKLHKQIAARTEAHGINSTHYLASLKNRLESILDGEQRKLLKELAKLIHQIREEGSEMDKMAALIKVYNDISHTLDGNLIPSVRERFARIVGKEVKYVKMQEPDNSDIWELGDMAIGATANLQSLQDKKDLGEEQVLLNKYLMQILDYRLASLPEEQAWDFVAQAILSESEELR